MLKVQICQTTKKNMGQLFFHKEPISEISKPYHAWLLRYSKHQKESQRAITMSIFHGIP